MRIGTAFLIALGGLSGCAYATDRARDLADVVDLRYGTGDVGFGVKARVTEFIGTGMGYAVGYDETEWLGRRKQEYRSNFVGLPGMLVQDGPGVTCPTEGSELGVFCLRLRVGIPHWTSYLRTGGELILPGVRGGLFLNAGEALDFVLGFATIDIAEDDGHDFGDPIEPGTGDWKEPEDRGS